MANMVNGLISQFTTVVMARPFGSFLTFTMALKSICAIIGKIIAQIRMAIGIDTWAYSKRDSVSGTTGASWPRATPATIAKATQTDRYLPNRSMPPLMPSVLVVSVLLVIAYPKTSRCLH